MLFTAARGRAHRNVADRHIACSCRIGSLSYRQYPMNHMGPQEEFLSRPKNNSGFSQESGSSLQSNIWRSLAQVTSSQQQNEVGKHLWSATICREHWSLVQVCESNVTNTTNEFKNSALIPNWELRIWLFKVGLSGISYLRGLFTDTSERVPGNVAYLYVYSETPI